MDLNIQHLDNHPPTGMVATVTAPVDIPFQTQWASSLKTLLCVTGHVKLLFLGRKKKKLLNFSRFSKKQAHEASGILFPGVY